jgi:hypothetical protein
MRGRRRDAFFVVDARQSPGEFRAAVVFLFQEESWVVVVVVVLVMGAAHGQQRRQAQARLLVEEEEGRVGEVVGGQRQVVHAVLRGVEGKWRKR